MTTRNEILDRVQAEGGTQQDAMAALVDYRSKFGGFDDETKPDPSTALSIAGENQVDATVPQARTMASTEAIDGEEKKERVRAYYTHRYGINHDDTMLANRLQGAYGSEDAYDKALGDIFQSLQYRETRHFDNGLTGKTAWNWTKLHSGKTAKKTYDSFGGAPELAVRLVTGYGGDNEKMVNSANYQFYRQTAIQQENEAAAFEAMSEYERIQAGYSLDNPRPVGYNWEPDLTEEEFARKSRSRTGQAALGMAELYHDTAREEGEKALLWYKFGMDQQKIDGSKFDMSTDITSELMLMAFYKGGSMLKANPSRAARAVNQVMKQVGPTMTFGRRYNEGISEAEAAGKTREEGSQIALGYTLAMAPLEIAIDKFIGGIGSKYVGRLAPKSKFTNYAKRAFKTSVEAQEAGAGEYVAEGIESAWLQYATTGEVDWKQVRQEALMGYLTGYIGGEMFGKVSMADTQRMSQKIADLGIDVVEADQMVDALNNAESQEEQNAILQEINFRIAMKKAERIDRVVNPRDNTRPQIPKDKKPWTLEEAKSIRKDMTDDEIEDIVSAMEPRVQAAARDAMTMPNNRRIAHLNYMIEEVAGLKNTRPSKAEQRKERRKNAPEPKQRTDQQETIDPEPVKEVEEVSEPTPQDNTRANKKVEANTDSRQADPSVFKISHNIGDEVQLGPWGKGRLTKYWTDRDGKRHELWITDTGAVYVKLGKDGVVEDHNHGDGGSINDLYMTVHDQAKGEYDIELWAEQLANAGISPIKRITSYSSEEEIRAEAKRLGLTFIKRTLTPTTEEDIRNPGTDPSVWVNPMKLAYLEVYLENDPDPEGSLLRNKGHLNVTPEYDGETIEEAYNRTLISFGKEPFSDALYNPEAIVEEDQAPLVPSDMENPSNIFAGMSITDLANHWADQMNLGVQPSVTYQIELLSRFDNAGQFKRFREQVIKRAVLRRQMDSESTSQDFIDLHVLINPKEEDIIKDPHAQQLYSSALSDFETLVYRLEHNWLPDNEFYRKRAEAYSAATDGKVGVNSALSMIGPQERRKLAAKRYAEFLPLIQAGDIAGVDRAIEKLKLPRNGNFSWGLRHLVRRVDLALKRESAMQRRGRNGSGGTVREESTPYNVNPHQPLRAYGFVSALENAALALPQSVYPVEQVIPALKKFGFKNEEADDIGLDLFLRGQTKVKKDDLVYFIQNGGLQLEEVYHSSNYSDIEAGMSEPVRHEKYVSKGHYIRYREFVFRAPWPLRPHLSMWDPDTAENVKVSVTRRENTYELTPEIFRLANFGAAFSETKFYFRQYFTREDGTKVLVSERSFDSEYEAQTYANDRIAQVDYLTSGPIEEDHFDYTNVMGHLRVSERKINGLRTLFIEEIQQGWRAAGGNQRTAAVARLIDKGIDPEEANQMVSPNAVFADKEILSSISAFRRESTDPWIIEYTINGQRKRLDRGVPQQVTQLGAVTMAVSQLVDDGVLLGAFAVPPVMSKNGTIEQLLVKRAAALAVHEGYDAVAWADGKEHAMMWTGPLRGMLDSIEWTTEITPEVYAERTDAYIRKANIADAAAENLSLLMSFRNARLVSEYGGVEGLAKAKQKAAQDLITAEAELNFESRWNGIFEDQDTVLFLRKKIRELTAIYNKVHLADNLLAQIQALNEESLSLRAEAKRRGSEEFLPQLTLNRADGSPLVIQYKAKSGTIVSANEKLGLVGKNIADLIMPAMAKKVLAAPSGKIESKDMMLGAGAYVSIYDNMIAQALKGIDKRIEVEQDQLRGSTQYNTFNVIDATNPNVILGSFDSQALANEFKDDETLRRTLMTGLGIDGQDGELSIFYGPGTSQIDIYQVRVGENMIKSVEAGLSFYEQYQKYDLAPAKDMRESISRYIEQTRSVNDPNTTTYLTEALMKLMFADDVTIYKSPITLVTEEDHLIVKEATRNALYALKKAMRAKVGEQSITGAEISAIRKALEYGGSFRLIAEALFNDPLPFSWNAEDMSIFTPADVHAAAMLHRSPFVESLKRICIDKAGNVLESKILSYGSINQTDVSALKVFSKIPAGTAGVIVIHNHPSGDPNPSSPDINVTKKLLRAANKLNVPLIDHVVTNGRAVYSMRDASNITFVDADLAYTQVRNAEEQIEYTAQVDANPLQAWETIHIPDSPILNSADLSIKMALLMRQADPNAGHIVILGTKSNVMGIERFDITGTTKEIAQAIGEIALRYPEAVSAVLDLPMGSDLETETVAKNAVNLLSDLQLELFDVIDRDYTSVRERDSTIFHPQAFGTDVLAEQPAQYNAELPIEEQLVQEAKALEQEWLEQIDIDLITGMTSYEGEIAMRYAAALQGYQKGLEEPSIQELPAGFAEFLMKQSGWLSVSRDIARMIGELKGLVGMDFEAVQGFYFPMRHFTEGRNRNSTIDDLIDSAIGISGRRKTGDFEGVIKNPETQVRLYLRDAARLIATAQAIAEKRYEVWELAEQIAAALHPEVNFDFEKEGDSEGEAPAPAIIPSVEAAMSAHDDLRKLEGIGRKIGISESEEAGSEIYRLIAMLKEDGGGQEVPSMHGPVMTVLGPTVSDFIKTHGKDWALIVDPAYVVQRMDGMEKGKKVDGRMYGANSNLLAEIFQAARLIRDAQVSERMKQRRILKQYASGPRGYKHINQLLFDVLLGNSVNRKLALGASVPMQIEKLFGISKSEAAVVWFYAQEMKKVFAHRAKAQDLRSDVSEIARDQRKRFFELERKVQEGTALEEEVNEYLSFAPKHPSGKATPSDPKSYARHQMMRNAARWMFERHAINHQDFFGYFDALMSDKAKSDYLWRLYNRVHKWADYLDSKGQHDNAKWWRIRAESNIKGDMFTFEDKILDIAANIVLKLGGKEVEGESRAIGSGSFMDAMRATTPAEMKLHIISALGILQRSRIYNFLLGNIGWTIVTQPTSIALTAKHAGIKGVLLAYHRLLFGDSDIRDSDVAMIKNRRVGGVSALEAVSQFESLSVKRTFRSKLRILGGYLGERNESQLTHVSFLAGYAAGIRKYGMDEDDAKIHGEFIAAVTQSMYDRVTRNSVLNSHLLRAWKPMQTFIFSNFSSVLDTIGVVGIKRSKLERLRELLNWKLTSLFFQVLWSIIWGDDILKALLDPSHDKNTLGSHIPVYGESVDQVVSNVPWKKSKKWQKEAAPAKFMRETMKALAAVAKQEPHAGRQTLIYGSQYIMPWAGFGAGVPIRNLINIESARQNYGRFEKVNGDLDKRLYDLDSPGSWSAGVLFGTKAVDAPESLAEQMNKD